MLSSHLLRVTLPVASHSIGAGFPSPATDYIDGTIDLNRELVQHPAATFCVRATGRSMEEAGIWEGTLLIVDRAIQARPGHIVVACLDGEFLVKRLTVRSNRWWLIAESQHTSFTPHPVDERVEIWGVVTTTIQQHV